MPETSTQTLAKTTRPLLASAVIPRPRLLARLDDALKGPAVWIHGMPGAGKTCLLAGFVESRRIDALWYQVDAGDGDPGSFLHHLGHAARRRFGAQAELPTPTTTGDALPESDLRRFFRALYRHFDGPFLLVLDNCHEVPITSAVHGMFSIATQEMPARGTVVFLARAEPGPALAKLRANDALAVIGPGELHLTPEETRAIAEARGLQLDEDTLRRLGEGTRGWAAGLVLMLEHTRAGGAVTRTPQGLAPQVVFDYLAWEVFRAFESDVQHVLCAIAELRRCTGPLAEHVSSSASATPALQNLARNGYFVSRIDEASETWFELHPLFQEFLRKQAAGRFTDAERSARLREAARWLERHGQLDEAVRILAQAHDWAALDQVVARIVAGSVDTPTTAELDAWLRAAPDHDPGAHPWLAYWLACSRLADDPRAARRLFAGAHEAFAAAGAGTPHGVGAALSAWGALRAVLHELDDLSLADAWTGPLESCLAEGRVTLPARLRGQMERTLHTALLLRGAEAARLAACRQRAAVIDCDGAAASDPTTWPTACVEACLRGDFTAAAHGLANAPADQASAPRALAACLYHLLRGEWDAGSAAQEEARAVLTGDDQHLLALLLAALAAAHALGRRASGDDESARPALPAGAPPRLRAVLSGYLEGWALALDGETLEAFHRYREAAASAAQLGLRPMEVACHAALAEAGAACGDAAQATAAVTRARAARGEGFPVLDFTRRIAAARVALGAEPPVPVAPALEAALGTGRAHGLRFTLGLCPDVAATLCATAITMGIEPEYARSLVRAHGLTAHAPPDAPEQWPWPIRVSTLGGASVSRHDTPLRLSGKGEGRLMELLKVLLALGARDVPQEQLAGALWPHVDGDYAQRSFNTTVYRLRKLLDVPDAILVREGRVSLNPACCWVDTWALETLLETIDAAFWEGAPPQAATAVPGFAQALQRLHRGAFLAGDDQRPVFKARRAHLRRRVQRGLLRLAGHWETHGESGRAVDLLQHALDVDPLAESVCRELMLLLERLDRPSEALEVYTVCTATREAAGEAEDASTRDIAERLRAAGRR